MDTLTVSDVMTTHVLTARPAMPLKELARVLTEHRVGALPVLDADDRVIGMVSERDLLSKQAQPLPRPRRWWQTRRARREIRRAEADTVAHLMTRRPVTVGPAAKLAEAARRMTEHELKHLPVVDDGGSLVGIVSRADLIGAYLRTDEQIRTAVLDDVFLHVLWTDATQVEVSVTDGIVTIDGTVEQRSTAEMAEHLVRRLDGVVDVVCTLAYRVDDGGLDGRPPHRPQARPTTTTDTAGITT
ncbi:CBS domain-containing protein [Pseudonocardia abyssalis]|uniref:CBS domain-containing protein n=1 Tax=Pseudonocardia abyssalis TaxID=2792008 RepID=A0ABS6UPI8_9PSEU|nr:CBS domain-containing protein [Pseudonocardia abyssalis]MBW0119018.1 CBS domain-containing protein [Pseudonocardia abyssalis]MBW0133813.1 CBS domain-containing protein [Pseudonocardia abyssalis]